MVPLKVAHFDVEKSRPRTRRAPDAQFGSGIRRTSTRMTAVHAAEISSGGVRARVVRVT